MVLFAVAHSAAANPPNVILITMDTTRADRMGFMGSKRGLTPHLDRMAEDSVVFTRAYSQVPLTTASHATILTGTYPQFHQVSDAGVPLAEDIPYAPQIFHEAKYHTAAFVGSIILDPVNGGAPGFDRGFDEYDANFHSRAPGEDRYQSLDRRGSEVVEHALTWIKKNSSSPFFIWIHLYDPHAPYDAPEPYASRFRAEPYDGEIAYADAAIGTLLDGLRASKLYDNAIIAFMADHGESFGEHGERGHGMFLYDSTIHVPLVFKMSGSKAGKRTDVRTELVNVLPTLLDGSGLKTPKAMQGHSLTGSMAEGAKSAIDENAPAYSETDFPHRAYGWSSLRSLRTGKYLYIEAPRPELYDQSIDSAAMSNLAEKSHAVSETLAVQLSKFREQTSDAVTAPVTAPDPEKQAKLQALGYVPSSSAPIASSAKGADPKDKIELANKMTEAYFSMEQFHDEEAIKTLQEVIAVDPTIAPAYAALGTAWMHVQKFDNAVGALRKASDMDPKSGWSHYQLGLALVQKGDLMAAATEFRSAVEYSPVSPEVRFALASMEIRTDRVEDAKKQLTKALELKPRYYDADLLMGFIFVVEKNAGAAFPFLQEAMELQPNSPEPHEYIAEAYAQIGDMQTAGQERRRASALKAGAQ